MYRIVVVNNDGVAGQHICSLALNSIPEDFGTVEALHYCEYYPAYEGVTNKNVNLFIVSINSKSEDDLGIKFIRSIRGNCSYYLFVPILVLWTLPLDDKTSRFIYEELGCYKVFDSTYFSKASLDVFSRVSIDLNKDSDLNKNPEILRLKNELIKLSEFRTFSKNRRFISMYYKNNEVEIELSKLAWVGIGNDAEYSIEFHLYGNYTTVHKFSNRDYRLKDLVARELGADCFLQIRRNYIVNKKYVDVDSIDYSKKYLRLVGIDKNFDMGGGELLDSVKKIFHPELYAAENVRKEFKAKMKKERDKAKIAKEKAEAEKKANNIDVEIARANYAITTDC